MKMATDVLINVINNKQDAILEKGRDLDQRIENLVESYRSYRESCSELIGLQKKLNALVKKSENVEKHNTTSMDVRPPSELNIDPCTAIFSQDTPGVVENTQLEERKSERWRNQHAEALKKLIFSNNNKKPTENPSKPLNADVKADTCVSTQTKNLGKLVLSQVDSKTNVSSSGKISRQSKLVLQPVNKKVDNNNCSKSATKPVKEIEFIDLDIDATLFEVPFTQEQTILEEHANNSTMHDEVIETSPIQNKKLSKKSHLKKNSPKCPSNDTGKKLEIKKREVQKPEVKKPEVKLPEAKPPGWSLKSWGIGAKDKELSREKNKSKENENVINRPALSQHFPSFSSDETFFTGEDRITNKKQVTPKKAENNSNTNKRKYPTTAGVSTTEETTAPTIPVIDYDVGSISDWESDMSCDKWQKTPPKKKVLMDSFDMLPKKNVPAPKFAFKGPVVRNKAQRAKLPGWDCKDCENYYKSLNLPQKELRERINQCSRHRSKFDERYQTPPGYWDLRFPETVSSSQE